MTPSRLRPTDPVDCQTHTTRSDGTWRGPDLVAYLADHGFRAAAITDHDAVDDGGALAALGAARGVALIPAAEMSGEWRGQMVDVLCYAAASLLGTPLAQLAARTRARIRPQVTEVYEELLRQGYRFPRQAAVLEAGVPQRPMDTLELLVAHGYATDVPAALALASAAGYSSIRAPVAEVVAAAHASGAVALVAHPGRAEAEIHRYDPPELEALLDEVPLDGFELYYPTHSAERIAAYGALARRRGLLVSAGSDSHGPDQRLPIPYPAKLCAALLARCGLALA